MGITGHKSYTASLPKYVDNSIVQKRTAAVAFSVSGATIAVANKENLKPRQVTVNKKSGRGNFEIVLNNSTVSQLKVIQKGFSKEEEEDDDDNDDDNDDS